MWRNYSGLPWSCTRRPAWLFIETLQLRYYEHDQRIPLIIWGSFWKIHRLSRPWQKWTTLAHQCGSSRLTFSNVPIIEIAVTTCQQDLCEREDLNTRLQEFNVALTHPGSTSKSLNWFCLVPLSAVIAADSGLQKWAEEVSMRFYFRAQQRYRW